jgi:hypothetical protein
MGSFATIRREAVPCRFVPHEQFLVISRIFGKASQLRPAAAVTATRFSGQDGASLSKIDSNQRAISRDYLPAGGTCRHPVAFVKGIGSTVRFISLKCFRQRESIDGAPAFLHRQITGTGCGDKAIAHPCAPVRASAFFSIAMGKNPQLAGS